MRNAYHPRTTLIVGHSGGSAIAADLIALRPELAGAALLVSCPRCRT
jgi:pimeloyl-ACP methyl ester carboxylesterase